MNECRFGLTVLYRRKAREEAETALRVHLGDDGVRRLGERRYENSFCPRVLDRKSKFRKRLRGGYRSESGGIFGCQSERIEPELLVLVHGLEKELGLLLLFLAGAVRVLVHVFIPVVFVSMLFPFVLVLVMFFITVLVGVLFPLVLMLVLMRMLFPVAVRVPVLVFLLLPVRVLGLLDLPAVWRGRRRSG